MANDNETTQYPLSEYPPVMNGTSIPFFPQIDNNPDKLEVVNESEGGKKIVQVIRDDVLSANITMAVADYTWVQFFYQLKLLDSFVFKQYSPLTNAYEERTVRLINFKYKARKKSEKLQAVTGVWDVSFTLEEF